MAKDQDSIDVVEIPVTEWTTHRDPIGTCSGCGKTILPSQSCYGVENNLFHMECSLPDKKES